MTNMSKHQEQQEQRQRLILRSRSEFKKMEESVEYGRRNESNQESFSHERCHVTISQSQINESNRMNRMNLEWLRSVRQSTV